jgi:hypothetical protein
MKKLLKITGVIALVVILVCNLEYAIFSGDMKNTPNKALADWYDSGSGIHYCGDSPNIYTVTGWWFWIDYDNDYWANPYYPDPIYDNYPSESPDGIWIFERDTYGTDCGPSMTYGGVNYDGAGTNSTITGWTNPYPWPYFSTIYSGGYGPY